MNRSAKYRRFPGILSAEDLGVAVLGSPHTAIVPPKHPVDRAEYGRRLAEAESGIFTPSGYFVPIKRTRGKHHAA